MDISELKVGDRYVHKSSYHMSDPPVQIIDRVDYMNDFVYLRSETYSDIITDISYLHFSLDYIKLNKVFSKYDCHHEFRPYHGFRESYEFCQICDKKRDIQ